MLLQTISILLQSKSFVARFEASSEARAHLVSFFCTCGVLKVKLLPRKCCWPVFEVLLFVFFWCGLPEASWDACAYLAGLLL